MIVNQAIRHANGLLRNAPKTAAEALEATQSLEDEGYSGKGRKMAYKRS